MEWFFFFLILACSVVLTIRKHKVHKRTSSSGSHVCYFPSFLSLAVKSIGLIVLASVHRRLWVCNTRHPMPHFLLTPWIKDSLVQRHSQVEPKWYQPFLCCVSSVYRVKRRPKCPAPHLNVQTGWPPVISSINEGLVSSVTLVLKPWLVTHKNPPWAQCQEEDREEKVGAAIILWFSKPRHSVLFILSTQNSA